MEVTHIGYFYMKRDSTNNDPEIFFMSLRGGDHGICVDKYGISKIQDIKTTGDSIKFIKKYISNCYNVCSSNESMIFNGKRINKQYRGKYSYLKLDNSQEEGNIFLMESLSNTSIVLNEIATGLEKKFE